MPHKLGNDLVLVEQMSVSQNDKSQLCSVWLVSELLKVAFQSIRACNLLADLVAHVDGVCEKALHLQVPETEFTCSKLHQYFACVQKHITC